MVTISKEGGAYIPWKEKSVELPREILFSSGGLFLSFQVPISLIEMDMSVQVNGVHFADLIRTTSTSDIVMVGGVVAGNNSLNLTRGIHEMTLIAGFTVLKRVVIKAV